MSDLSIDDLLPAHLIGTIKFMAIAEEEIEMAVQQHPLKAALLRDAFLTVVPTFNMPTLAVEVYRAHVRELLDRIAHKQDVRPGTLAEVMIALSETSLHVPLHHTAAYLYMRTFAHIFGEDHPIVLESKRNFHEPYDGAADELESQLRRKLTQPQRHKPDPNRWQPEQAPERERESIPPAPPATYQPKLF